MPYVFEDHRTPQAGCILPSATAGTGWLLSQVASPAPSWLRDLKAPVGYAVVSDSNSSRRQRMTAIFGVRVPVVGVR